MFSSSGRAQTEPIAALLAILVVSAGLAFYAGVLDDALSGSPDRDVAASTLERVEAHLTPNGVVVPSKIPTTQEVTPDGYLTNVTLTVDDQRWTAGPPTVPDATASSRTVSVWTGPASVERGILRVVTWT